MVMPKRILAWRSQNDPEILIEVKTTDYVTVSLDKIATHKTKLYAEQRIKVSASMLITDKREIRRSGHYYSDSESIIASRWRFSLRIFTLKSPTG
jgi:hypothetical protein